MSGKIAVVIPARNEARWIGEAVRSARRQAPVHEVVVVDDGSDDDTPDRAASAGARVIANRGRGLCAARWTGVEATTAPLLTVLDADDRLRAGALERLQRPFSASHVVVTYGEVCVINSAGARLADARPPRFASRAHGNVLEALLRASFIATTGATCIRRRALVAAGPWRETFIPAEDWELWCRLALAGHFAYVGLPAVTDKRRHADSISASRDCRSAATAAVDAVFSAPEVKARFSSAELEVLRRQQIASQLVLGAVVALRAARWRDAQGALAQALALSPRHPPAWILLGCAMARRLPAPVARRLK